MIRICTALVVALTVAHPAGAERIAITGARVLTSTPAGAIEAGTVIVCDGVIEAVGGAGIAVPADARRIDATGKTVTTGLFASETQIGLTSLFNQDGDDDSGSKSRALRAAFDPQYALNENVPAIAEARSSGTTRALVTPTLLPVPDKDPSETSFFAGQALLIQLGAGNDLLMRARVASVVPMGQTGARLAGGSRAVQIQLLRRLLQEARAAAKPAPGARKPASPELEALVPVIERRQKLLVTVNREADIRQVLALARDENIQLVLNGAAEGWRVAREIAAAKVPVIVNPYADAAQSFDAVGGTLENAARLQEAGVLLSFTDIGLPLLPERSPRIGAGIAVGHGLPHAAALAAITINPARIWGIDDRFGTIEKGKDADLVIWSGDPLEASSWAEQVLIKGKPQAMESRSTLLRDRYRPNKN